MPTQHIEHYIFLYFILFFSSNPQHIHREARYGFPVKKKIKESTPTKIYNYSPWDPPPLDYPNNNSNNYIPHRHKVCIYIIHYGVLARRVYRPYAVERPRPYFYFIQSSTAQKKILYYFIIKSPRFIH